MEAQVLPRTGRLFLPRSPKVLAALSDEKLVEQVRRGNEAAFEVVYDRHHRGILSFSRHMLGSADEAEDAVQQTFISAYDALQSDSRDIRLKAWLYTIARNRCLSILRSRREQPAELDEVPVAGLSEEVQQRADLRELLADVQGLPVDQRAALVLAEVGDLSHAEVGAIVGCEVAKVKSLVFQARSSLIESRRAREIPCQEIREQLATATGGVLRRGPLRRHVRACAGCAEFRDDVMRQRKALALILPVVPTLGLKKAALSAMGVGGGGGGGAAVGGGIASLLSSSAAVKVTAAAVLAGITVGGGLVVDQGSKPPAAEAAGAQGGGQAWPAPPGGAGPGTHAIAAARHVAATRPVVASRPNKVALNKAPATSAPAASTPRKHARATAPTVHHGSKQPTSRRHAGGPTRHHHSGGSGGHVTHTPATPTPAPQPAPQPVAPTPTTTQHTSSSHGHHGHHGGDGEHAIDHSGPPPYGNAWGHDVNHGDGGGDHGDSGHRSSGDGHSDGHGG
jgi:RNA polymerase sigma factor (sigma-70 family)